MRYKVQITGDFLHLRCQTYRLSIFSWVSFVSWATRGPSWSLITHSPMRARVPTKTWRSLLPGLPYRPSRSWSSLVWHEKKTQKGKERKPSEEDWCDRLCLPCRWPSLPGSFFSIDNQSLSTFKQKKTQLQLHSPGEKLNIICTQPLESLLKE